MAGIVPLALAAKRQAARVAIEVLQEHLASVGRRLAAARLDDADACRAAAGVAAEVAAYAWQTQRAVQDLEVALRMQADGDPIGPDSHALALAELARLVKERQR